jgi:hypothetical protein
MSLLKYQTPQAAVVEVEITISSLPGVIIAALLHAL